MRNAFLLTLLIATAFPCLGAEAYPAKPVRIIVPSGPGSTTDSTGRIIAKQLSEQLGKSFIVENRAGAIGAIGNAYVAQSAPDGYTLLIADTASTIAPAINSALPYNVAKDFTAITQIVRVPLAIVVNSALNVTTLKQFIALAQANPGKLNYGSAGTGGANHLSTELFRLAAKVNLVHVPYKGGGGEAMAALLGEQIQLVITAVPTVLAQVNNGRLRALAVTTDGKRLASMPDVPSMSEAGFPGVSVYVWFGLSGPAGMPSEIVNRLHSEVVKALAVPSVRETLVTQSAEVVGSSPEEFTTYIRSELQRWAEVVKSSGIAGDY